MSDATGNEQLDRWEQLREELRTTRAPGNIARFLNKRLGFSQADLSAATGAHSRTVSGWLGQQAQAPGNIDHKQKLRQLKALVDLGLDDRTIAEDLVRWFRFPNRNLGYLTPLELIAEERWKQVGGSMCDEMGIPKPARPEAFQPEHIGSL